MAHSNGHVRAPSVRPRPLQTAPQSPPQPVRLLAATTAAAPAASASPAPSAATGRVRTPSRSPAAAASVARVRSDPNSRLVSELDACATAIRGGAGTADSKEYDVLTTLVSGAITNIALFTPGIAVPAIRQTIERLSLPPLTAAVRVGVSRAIGDALNAIVAAALVPSPPRPGDTKQNATAAASTFLAVDSSAVSAFDLLPPIFAALNRLHGPKSNSNLIWPPALLVLSAPHALWRGASIAPLTTALLQLPAEAIGDGGAGVMDAFARSVRHHMSRLTGTNGATNALALVQLAWRFALRTTAGAATAPVFESALGAIRALRSGGALTLSEFATAVVPLTGKSKPAERERWLTAIQAAVSTPAAPTLGADDAATFIVLTAALLASDDRKPRDGAADAKLFHALIASSAAGGLSESKWFATFDSVGERFIACLLATLTASNTTGRFACFALAELSRVDSVQTRVIAAGIACFGAAIPPPPVPKSKPHATAVASSQRFIALFHHPLAQRGAADAKSRDRIAQFIRQNILPHLAPVSQPPVAAAATASSSSSAAAVAAVAVDADTETAAVAGFRSLLERVTVCLLPAVASNAESTKEFIAALARADSSWRHFAIRILCQLLALVPDERVVQSAVADALLVYLTPDTASVDPVTRATVLQHLTAALHQPRCRLAPSTHAAFATRVDELLKRCVTGGGAGAVYTLSLPHCFESNANSNGGVAVQKEQLAFVLQCGWALLRHRPLSSASAAPLPFVANVMRGLIDQLTTPASLHSLLFGGGSAFAPISAASSAFTSADALPCPIERISTTLRVALIMPIVECLFSAMRVPERTDDASAWSQPIADGIARGCRIDVKRDDATSDSDKRKSLAALLFELLPVLSDVFGATKAETAKSITPAVSAALSSAAAAGAGASSVSALASPSNRSKSPKPKRMTPAMAVAVVPSDASDPELLSSPTTSAPVSATAESPTKRRSGDPAAVAARAVNEYRKRLDDVSAYFVSAEACLQILSDHFTSVRALTPSTASSQVAEYSVPAVVNAIRILNMHLHDATVASESPCHPYDRPQSYVSSDGLRVTALRPDAVSRAVGDALGLWCATLPVAAPPHAARALLLLYSDVFPRESMPYAKSAVRFAQQPLIDVLYGKTERLSRRTPAALSVPALNALHALIATHLRSASPRSTDACACDPVLSRLVKPFRSYLSDTICTGHPPLRACETLSTVLALYLYHETGTDSIPSYLGVLHTLGECCAGSRLPLAPPSRLDVAAAIVQRTYAEVAFESSVVFGDALKYVCRHYGVNGCDGAAVAHRTIVECGESKSRIQSLSLREHASKATDVAFQYFDERLRQMRRDRIVPVVGGARAIADSFHPLAAVLMHAVRSVHRSPNRSNSGVTRHLLLCAAHIARELRRTIKSWKPADVQPDWSLDVTRAVASSANTLTDATSAPALEVMPSQKASISPTKKRVSSFHSVPVTPVKSKTGAASASASPAPMVDSKSASNGSGSSSSSVSASAASTAPVQPELIAPSFPVAPASAHSVFFALLHVAYLPTPSDVSFTARSGIASARRSLRDRLTKLADAVPTAAPAASESSSSASAAAAAVAAASRFLDVPPFATAAPRVYTKAAPADTDSESDDAESDGDGGLDAEEADDRKGDKNYRNRSGGKSKSKPKSSIKSPKSKSTKSKPLSPQKDSKARESAAKLEAELRQIGARATLPDALSFIAEHIAIAFANDPVTDTNRLTSPNRKSAASAGAGLSGYDSLDDFVENDQSNDDADAEDDDAADRNGDDATAPAPEYKTGADRPPKFATALPARLSEALKASTAKLRKELSAGSPNKRKTAAAGGGRSGTKKLKPLPPTAGGAAAVASPPVRRKPASAVASSSASVAAAAASVTLPTAGGEAEPMDGENILNSEDDIDDDDYDDA